MPATGTWFGIGIDWGADTVAGVRSRLGADRTPAVWVQFAQFPLTPDDRTHLEGFIEQVRTVGGIGLITLEPNGATREAIIDRLVHLGFEVRAELLRDDGEHFAVQLTRDEAERLELAPGQIVYARPVKHTVFETPKAGA